MRRIRRAGQTGPGPRHARRGSFRRHVILRTAMAASLVAVVAGLATGAYIGWFYWRSDHVGGSLIKREQSTIKSASLHGRCATNSPSASSASTPPESSLIGLIVASSIDLEAPVVQGVANPQLDVAVGHVPASALPGRPGTAVLSAHDVTWFSQINRLHPGDQVLVEEPCSTLHYRVESGQVVAAGAPIYTSSASKLALVTCYPLNALFITSKRYVITADLEGETTNGQSTVAAPAAPTDPITAPVPAQLAAQGLTLKTNDAPLGTLGFAGNPPLAVRESPLPIQLETTLLQLYFAAIHSAEQNRADWWSAIAPGTPFAASSPLRGATISKNDALVDPTLTFSGANFTGGTISSEPMVTGGAHPGVYRLTMQAQVKGSQLLISGWSMTWTAAAPGTGSGGYESYSGESSATYAAPGGYTPAAPAPAEPPATTSYTTAGTTGPPTSSTSQTAPAPATGTPTPTSVPVPAPPTSADPAATGPATTTP